MNTHGIAGLIALVEAFVLAVLTAKILIPILRRLKAGQTVRDDGPATHLHKSGTPTMGGLIFLLPTTFVMCQLQNVIEACTPSPLIPSLFPELFPSPLPSLFSSLLPILLAILGFGAVGLTDDLIIIIKKQKDGLTPAQKSVGILAVSAAFSAYMAFFTENGTTVVLPLTGMSGTLTLPWWIYVPFMVFVMYATTNAVNLTDGVDGLCSVVTVIVMAAFSVAGTLLMPESVVIPTVCLTLLGGLLGFLCFNRHPAKVFMGDCGSLALGGAVAVAAAFARVPWIILPFGLVYVAEALSVVLQVTYYKRTKKRIFRMTPIHHHFELGGWRENKVVAVFAAVTVISCAMGILLLVGSVF